MLVWKKLHVLFLHVLFLHVLFLHLKTLWPQFSKKPLLHYLKTKLWYFSIREKSKDSRTSPAPKRYLNFSQIARLFQFVKVLQNSSIIQARSFGYLFRIDLPSRYIAQNNHQYTYFRRSKRRIVDEIITNSGIVISWIPERWNPLLSYKVFSYPCELLSPFIFRPSTPLYRLWTNFRSLGEKIKQCRLLEWKGILARTLEKISPVLT